MNESTAGYVETACPVRAGQAASISIKMTTTTIYMILFVFRVDGNFLCIINKAVHKKLSLWQKNKEVKGNVLQKLWKRNPR